ncbi:hypothetical protein ID866_5804 [Astraeus odoratus]|nr:hypothetical protein ID866_5804 [Astraeus odoratus]
MEAASRADYPSSGRRSHRSPSVDSDEEDLSPPRELRKSPPPMVPASFPTLLIPTRWCEEMRYSHLSVSPDGRELTYQGNPSAPEKDTATARTAVPVPPACGIYYFEVEIGGKAQKSRVSIGFIGREVKLSRLPGWEKNSWGYHGDTATVCSGEKNGTSFGSVFGVGDIIGCGIDFSQNKVFYTKNGALLGTVFDNVGKDGDIFPAVGLCHTLESVKANFGQEPFKYDIEDHVLQQRNQMWAKIQSHPLKWPNECKINDGAEASVTEESVKTPLNELILTYLSHHGYVRTARAFEASCSVRGGLLASSSPKVTRPGAPSIKVEDSVMDLDLGNASPSSLPANCRSSNVLGTDDIETRTHIVQSIIAGDIDTALSETQAHFPLVLEADGGIMLFKLRCRKFVELVLDAAELKKKMQVEEDGMSTEPVLHGEARNSDTIKTIPEGMDMDVDDELPGTRNRTNGYATSSRDDIPSELARKSTPLTSVSTDFVAATAAQYGAALEKAVLYGQELESEYKHRSEVRAIFKRTSVIMAYYDPLEAGGDAAEVAGQSARVTLATELNQAILRKYINTSDLEAEGVLTAFTLKESQGHPAQPLLDRLYRHTAVCLTNLAMTGTGAAAFADIQKEFLDA